MNDGTRTARDKDLVVGTSGASDFSARQHFVDHAGHRFVRVDIVHTQTQILETPSHVTIVQRGDEALQFLDRQQITAICGYDRTDGGAAALQFLHRLHRRLQNAAMVKEEFVRLQVDRG